MFTNYILVANALYLHIKYPVYPRRGVVGGQVIEAYHLPTEGVIKSCKVKAFTSDYLDAPMLWGGWL